MRRLLMSCLAAAVLVAGAPAASADDCEDCKSECKKGLEQCRKADKGLCRAPGVGGVCRMFRNAQCPAAEKICRHTRCGLLPSCDPSPTGGGGRLSGDPHATSLDRERFDFQAVGEFVVARSGAADLEVQARLTASGDRVSLMTMAAVRAGGHVIVFRPGAGPLVDGEVPELLEEGLHLGAGVSVLGAGEGRFLVTSGPTHLWLQVHRTYLDLDLEPDRGTRGSWVGLLGDFNGRDDDDLRTRGGEVLPRKDLTPADFYQKWGGSWRVTQEESILLYGEGETTATFTDLSMPRAHYAITDQDPEAFARAREACMARGVRSGEALRNCIYDVGASGSEDFIDSYVGIAAVERAATILFGGSFAMRAQASGHQGEQIPVFFSGAAGDDVKITLADAAGKVVARARTREGSPATLRLPAEVGTYTLTLAQGERTATQELAVTEVQATLSAPDTVEGAGALEVTWTGPLGQGDFIALMPPGATDPRQMLAHVWANRPRSPTFQAPAAPGTYELWYVLQGAGDRKPIARKAVTVTEPHAKLTAPAQVEVGAAFTVAVTGPRLPGDYVELVTGDGGDRAKKVTHGWIREAPDVELKAPIEPGAFTVRYVATTSAGPAVLATAPVEVTDGGTQATISAPDSVEGATAIDVSWTGPQRQGDYVALVERGETNPAQHLAYIWAQRKRAPSFKAPAKPGTYELVYVLHGADGLRVLARKPLTVTEPHASVTVPGPVEAGAFFEVSFTGPAGAGDFIAVTPANAPRTSGNLSYAWAQKQDGARLRAPPEPGRYQVRYVASAQWGQAVLATAPLTVTDVAATLEAPAQAAPGADVEVSWTGPNHPNDYVCFAAAGETRPHNHLDYRYVSDAGKATLRAPEAPGTYDVLYVLEGGGGRRILARRSIEVKSP